MYTAQLEKNRFPFSIRYPRGRGVYKEWEKPFQEIEIGKGRQLNEGNDIAILSIGHPGTDVAAVVNKLSGENISIAHFDMRFVSPVDTKILDTVFSKFSHIITVEDGVLKGGFGSAVIEYMCDKGYNSEIRRLGIPDYFVEHGTQEELYRECGYDKEGIEIAIREIILKLKG